MTTIFIKDFFQKLPFKMIILQPFLVRNHMQTERTVSFYFKYTFFHFLSLWGFMAPFMILGFISPEGFLKYQLIITSALLFIPEKHHLYLLKKESFLSSLYVLFISFGGSLIGLICAYFWACMNPTLRSSYLNSGQEKFNSLTKDTPQFRWEKKIENYRKNTKLFLEENFVFSSSLMKFLHDRSLSQGNYLYSFLLTLPLKKHISVDNLKWIIVGTQYEKDSKMIYNLMSKKYFNQETLDHCFKKYTEEDIKKILTKSYNMKEWITLLHVALKKGTELEVVSSIRELYSQVVNTKKIQNTDIYARVHKMEKDGYKFLFLHNKFEYETLGDQLSNCVATYFVRDGDIVAIYKDNLPYACLELKDGSINQLLGYKNRRLDSTELKHIKELFRQGNQ